MRVILLNQYYPPSVAPTGTLLADVAAALADRGAEVVVICSDRDYADPARRFPRRECHRGVSVRRVRTSGFGRGGWVGRLLDYATFLVGASYHLVVRPRPDWIVALTTPPLVAVVARLIGGIRGARIAYWVMDVYPELAFRLGVMRRGSLAGRFFGFLSGWILRRSDRVIALGDTMAQRLRDEGALDVAVIHNWIDGDAVRPRSLEGHRLRAQRQWSDRFVVLYSGNLGLAHDFETVLAAAEQMRGEPAVRFAFAGAGARLDELREEAERRKLDNMEFLPWVEHDALGESLTAADLHLVTLKNGVEGLLVPSKIYGILAAGRPTVFVGPEQGELPTILHEERCGQRVAVGDAEGLVEAIRGYRDDPARGEREGERARAAFEGRFEQRISVGRFVALLLGEAEPG